MNVHEASPALAASSPLSRRTLLTAAAWGTPVLVFAAAAPTASASTALSSIDGNYYPFDAALAVDQSTDAIITFVERSGNDYTGVVSILISPSRESDAVIARLLAFGPIVSDDSPSENWSYAREGNKLRVTYTGYMEADIGIHGYLYAENGAGVRVDTDGYYLATETSHVIEVESAKAVADQRQWNIEVEYGTDGIGAP